LSNCRCRRYFGAPWKHNFMSSREERCSVVLLLLQFRVRIGYE
ncbi:hypothetical protein CMV_000920, partial [Castanea mollissima]